MEIQTKVEIDADTGTNPDVDLDIDTGIDMNRFFKMQLLHRSRRFHTHSGLPEPVFRHLAAMDCYVGLKDS